MKIHVLKLCIFILCSLLLIPDLVVAQTEQATGGKPPFEQPLIREGDMAVKLVEALGLGAPVSETEAESILASLDIIPGSGWIADYPVTPDIAEELQSDVVEAAESGKIAISKRVALKTFQDIMNGYEMPLITDASGQGSGETAGPNYPDTSAESEYYYDEGPPVVTYYAPPADYAYLYTWVSYPFWWSDFWFPGYFILNDFDVPEHRHKHGHGHDHDHGKFISNHFTDPKTGGTFRIEPGRKPHGGPFRAGTGLNKPFPKEAPQAVSHTNHGQPATGTYKEFRGFGMSGSHTDTHSSAFDRSPNSQFERKASDRGFQSRSNAGRVTSVRPDGGRSVRDDGMGGFHGGSGLRH